MMQAGGDGQLSKAQLETYKWPIRGLCTVMVPVTSVLPAAVHIFWITNSSFSMVQSRMLTLPSVRKYFALPDVPPDNASKTLMQTWKDWQESRQKKVRANKEIDMREQEYKQSLQETIDLALISKQSDLNKTQTKKGRKKRKEKRSIYHVL